LEKFQPVTNAPFSGCLIGANSRLLFRIVVTITVNTFLRYGNKAKVTMPPVPQVSGKVISNMTLPNTRGDGPDLDHLMSHSQFRRSNAPFPRARLT
jgi:hypothetical protein